MNVFFGDFVLHAVAHCIPKDILIFNTHFSNSQILEPVSVVEASTLSNRQANSTIPVVVAYNGVHYESLVPDKGEDVDKTIALKNQFLTGTYQKPDLISGHFHTNQN